MGRQSSAYGYSQALDGTWEEYQAEQRAFRARRDDIDHATDFMGWYFKKSEEDLGISISDARNQYLAYHEGRTGYKRGSYRRKAWLMRVSKESRIAPCFTTPSSEAAGWSSCPGFATVPRSRC